MDFVLVAKMERPMLSHSRRRRRRHRRCSFNNKYLLSNRYLSYFY